MIAHYYRFEQIVWGHMLIRDSKAAHGFSFTGQPLDFDASSVWPITPNQKLRDLALTARPVAAHDSSPTRSPSC